MKKANKHTDTTNSLTGIPTPYDEQDVTPTDMLNEAVEQAMDNVQKAFTGDKTKEQRSQRR